jgi:hypothetical protein
MNSHNAKSAFSYHKTPVADDSALKEAEVISSKLTVDANLTIDEDPEQGCDPYNATGQHVILQQKKLPKE